MKSSILLFLGFILVVDSTTAQDPPTPGTPQIGWDSLSSLIRYPEIPRRVGMEGAAYVSGVIDTSGIIDTVTIYAIEPFKEAVRKAIYLTKWHCPKHMKWSFHFNVHFMISGFKRVNVEVEPFHSKPIE